MCWPDKYRPNRCRVLSACAGCGWGGIQSQTTSERSYGTEAVTVEIVDDALVDFAADQWVIEQGGTDTDGGGAGNQEFNGILGRGNSTLADDRDVVRPGNFVNLARLQ